MGTDQLFAMIAVNALANVIPLGGQKTGGQYMRIVLVAMFSILVLSIFIYKVIYDDFIKDKA